jgi:hypothetical protein
MPRLLHMNTFQSAWNHYKQNVMGYHCDDGTIEFRYEDTDNGDTINIVINYIVTNNINALHQLLKHIIDDLPIDCQTEITNSSLGTIIFKGYSRGYTDFGLDQFHYKNKKFIVQGKDCVMISVAPEDE